MTAWSDNQTLVAQGTAHAYRGRIAVIEALSWIVPFAPGYKASNDK